MEKTTEEILRRKIEVLESQIKGFDKKILSIAEDHAEHLKQLYKKSEEQQKQIDFLKKKVFGE